MGPRGKWPATNRLIHGTALKTSTNIHYKQKFPISNFTKILPVGAELIHADRRTDRRRTDRHDDAKRHLSQLCEGT
jgi:hypothetical protein